MQAGPVRVRAVLYFAVLSLATGFPPAVQWHADGTATLPPNVLWSQRIAFSREIEIADEKRFCAPHATPPVCCSLGCGSVVYLKRFNHWRSPAVGVSGRAWRQRPPGNSGGRRMFWTIISIFCTAITCASNEPAALSSASPQLSAGNADKIQHSPTTSHCKGRLVSGFMGEDYATEALTAERSVVSKYLYAPSFPDNPTFRSQLSAQLDGQPVDYFDTSAATPSVEYLSQYAAVFTWRGSAYADPTAFGNNLADYVDQGGRVILGMWCLDGMGGRIMTPEYCPVTGMSWTWPGDFCYNHDGTQCATANVEHLCALWLDGILGLQPGAQSDGSLGDVGFPLAAWNAPMNVWYSTGNEGGSYGSGDWHILTANEMTCPGPAGACCNIRTGECLDLIPVPDCGQMGASWRTRAPIEYCADLVSVCGDPGACCDPFSGTCIDDVFAANCLDLGHQPTSGVSCAHLDPPCGNPGCCCDWPEPGVPAEPHFAFQANCGGRFIPGAYPFCGDLDESGVVDINDYNLFLDGFGACADQAGYIPAADLDNDGCISLVDFQTWRNCYLYQGSGCEADMFEPECGMLEP